MIKPVADLYNQGLSVSEIQKIIGYCINTIRRWLTMAAKYNLCNYNRKESRRRTDDSIYRYINQYSINREFIRSYKCIAEASEATGANHSSIYGCCRHYPYHKTAGGFLWFYATDPDQPDKSKIILNNTKLPLSESAYKSGFSTEYSLIRFFKRETGITPGKYRNSNV